MTQNQTIGTCDCECQYVSVTKQKNIQSTNNIDRNYFMLAS